MSTPSPVQTIPIDSIHFESLIYPREIKDSYNGEPFWYHVDRYQKALMVGHKMPPITVANIEGKTVLIDGYHRMLAMKRLKKTEIEAQFIEIRDWNEAFLESVGRNVIHGAPLGKWEMVRAANRLMTDGGYPPEQISFVVGMPQVDLDRQVQQRLHVAPDSGQQIFVKRPLVGQELPPEFSNETQSPINFEYQTQILRQLNYMLEHSLLDLASKGVLAEVNRLSKNIKDLTRAR